MQLLLREKVSLCVLSLACAYENRWAKKHFCNARGRYKEIRPSQQPTKSLVLALPYHKKLYSDRHMRHVFYDIDCAKPFAGCLFS